MPIPSPWFWSAGGRSEVPIAASLSRLNLLERLTELIGIFYLLDYGFIIKKNKLRNSQVEDIHRACGKEHGASMSPPLKCHSLKISNLHMFSNRETLQTLSFWVCMGTFPHRRDSLNHRPLGLSAIPGLSLFPGSVAGNWSFQFSNHRIDFTGKQATSSGALQVTSLTWQKTLLSFSSQ